MAFACNLAALIALCAVARGQAQIVAPDHRAPDFLHRPSASAAERRMVANATCTKKDAWQGKDHCPFQGFFPLLGDMEKSWPNELRLLLYLIGLAWTFLGIAIISDIFMAGIEKVTSWKKRVKDKQTGRTVTIYIWNATVANLTLMALGSSAPEILLSLIEIIQNDMFLGDLGAGTIVGSAAFNLLIISAVCVMAIPDPEIRYIKQTTVYAITATSSVLAYVWLMVILMVITPNVCTLMEAVLTLLFCPLLVGLAYLADKGYFDKQTTEEKVPIQTIPDDVTHDELAMIEQQIREQHGADLTSEQVVEIMASQYFTQRSRAYYRRAAMMQMKNSKRKQESLVRRLSVSPPDQDTYVTKAIETSDCVARDKQAAANDVVMGFEVARYAFLENCGHAQIILVRSGPLQCRATVKYKTRDGTATAADDYEASEGAVIFEKGEERKELLIKIFDDNAYEDNEEFYVDLSEAAVEGSASCSAKLSEITSVMVVIIDDDEPGVIKFQAEEVEVEEEVEGSTVEVVVERVGGASGKVSCKYETQNMNAVAGMDYEATSGKVELEGTVQTARIQVTINPKGRFEKTSSFLVRLTHPVGCVFDKDTDGGTECCICNVTIKGKQGTKELGLMTRMQSTISSQQVILGGRHWRKQFYDAVFQVVDDDDDDDNDDEESPKEQNPPSLFDYFVHLVSLPWKLLFACVPPTDYCGGWACFFASLMMIAVVTAIVGDLANLVGCCMKIEAEITAITFVALGTSLPDTFASKAAAVMDPYADASIGNITGSNSVNVFIGLGLSWTLAAVYWEFGEPNEEWNRRVNDPSGPYYKVRDDVISQQKDGKAVFVTPAGTLWFNLMVFSANAFFAIQHLLARRKKFGGELGGPRKGFMGQYFSAAFLVGQWVLYVTASSIWAIQSSSDC